jgi:hypothetical protein
MSVKLPKEQQSNILLELRKVKKKIYCKKCTPMNQWGWDTYYLWEYKIIGKIKWWQKTIKSNHPRLISTMYASPIAWGITFQIMEQNIKINEKREMKKLSQVIIGKRQFVLPDKFNNFQVELYGPNRSKQKSEIKKKLSDNPIKMIKLDEKTNFKLERINSNIPSFSSLPSSDKEIEIQVYPYQDIQYSSNVQYQQKIGSNKCRGRYGNYQK